MSRPSAAMWFSLALGAATTAAAWDVSEWVTELGTTDKAASQPADCWCKVLSALVDSRLNYAEDEINQLTRTKTTQFYENNALRLEVNKHQQEASGHSETLGTSQAISARKQTNGQQEVEDLEASLKSVRKAMDALPAGASGGQVHGALKGLEDRFSDHLEDAKQSLETQQSQTEGLHSAKQEMIRLANAHAAMKQKRLAAGLAIVAEAEKQLEVFNAQQQTDYALRTVVKSLCGSLESQATERLNKRQALAVSSSQHRADEAQAASLQASGLVLLRGAARVASQSHTVSVNSANKSTVAVVKAHTNRLENDCTAAIDLAEGNQRRQQEMLATTEKNAKELMDVVAKSQDLENNLKAMLHGQMTSAHLAESKVSGDAVKADVDAIFKTVQAQMASLEAPFNDVREKGRASSLADSRLVIQLRSAVADANLAVINAKNC